MALLYWGGGSSGDSADSENWFVSTIDSDGVLTFVPAGKVPGVSDSADFGALQASGTVTGGLVCDVAVGGLNWTFDDGQYLLGELAIGGGGSNANVTFGYDSILSMSSFVDLNGTLTVDGTADIPHIFLEGASVLVDWGSVTTDFIEQAGSDPGAQLEVGGTLTLTDASYPSYVGFEGAMATLCIQPNSVVHLSDFSASDTIDIKNFNGAVVSVSGSQVILESNTDAGFSEVILDFGATPPKFILASDGAGGTDLVAVYAKGDSSPPSVPPAWAPEADHVGSLLLGLLKNYAVKDLLSGLKQLGGPLPQDLITHLDTTKTKIGVLTNALTVVKDVEAIQGDAQAIYQDFPNHADPSGAVKDATERLFEITGTILGTWDGSALGKVGGQIGFLAGDVIFHIADDIAKIIDDVAGDIVGFTNAVATGDSFFDAADQAYANLTGQINGGLHPDDVVDFKDSPLFVSHARL